MADSSSTFTLGRRSFLGLAGGVLGAGALAACGDNTGRGDTSSTSGGGSLRLSQWYHQYGEAGTQQAVENTRRPTPAPRSTCSGAPGDYDTEGRHRRC